MSDDGEVVVRSTVGLAKTADADNKDADFVIRPRLTGGRGGDQEMVSIESMARPGQYLYAKDGKILCGDNPSAGPLHGHDRTTHP